MIRYPIGHQPLLDQIEQAKPGWLEKARTRLRKVLRRDKRFHEVKDDQAPAPNWSDVKPVYRELQGHKCAYCERPLPPKRGAGEHQVDHFRPKGRTVEWVSPESVGLVHKAGRPGGYYWLAYDPWNYAVSCYTCNSAEVKGDRFPIRGTPGQANWTIRRLDQRELPILVYPLGTRDSDPEELIGWRGVVPRAKAGPEGDRAVANIEFFQLAHEDFNVGRASQLVAAWSYIKAEHEAETPAEQAVAAANLETLRDRKRPFAACVRAFIALARKDFDEAQKIFARVEALHRSLGN